MWLYGDDKILETTIKVDIVHTTSHCHRYSYRNQQTADNVKKLNGHEKLSSCSTQWHAAVRKTGKNCSRSLFIHYFDLTTCVCMKWKTLSQLVRQKDNHHQCKQPKRQIPRGSTNIHYSFCISTIRNELIFRVDILQV